MGRLVEAIKMQTKALKRIEESGLWSKWDGPDFCRFFGHGEVRMPGDDAWGKRPNALPRKPA